MKINVPESARAEFWHEPPPGHNEFWGFRFKPKCVSGDPIYFYFDGEMVATAVVSHIEPPGKSSCQETGRFKNLWKVHWNNDSFSSNR